MTTPCQCSVSAFCASLIPQPWMQSKDHVVSTLCRCGKRYYCWHLRQWFDAKEGAKAVEDTT